MTKGEYRDYLKSAHWLAFRQTINLERGQCEYCGSTELLQVHHRHYRSLGREKRGDVNLLCNTCHEKVTYGVLAVPAYSAWPRKARGWLQALVLWYDWVMKKRQITLDESDIKRAIAALHYMEIYPPKGYVKDQLLIRQSRYKLRKIQDVIRQAQLGEVMELTFERTG